MRKIVIKSDKINEKNAYETLSIEQNLAKVHAKLKDKKRVCVRYNENGERYKIKTYIYVDSDIYTNKTKKLQLTELLKRI